MKHFKTSIVFFLSLIIALNSNCQGLNNVLHALKEKKVGKKICGRFEQNISQATYLGAIYDKKGVLKFHVVKEFYKVKAAVVYHGHSRVLFFNSKNRLVAQTMFDMPNELPYKLIHNALYFKRLGTTLPHSTKIYISEFLPKEINGYITQNEN